MNVSLCDFCGGEMKQGERRAMFTIRDGRTRERGDPFSFMFVTLDESKSLEMCAGCLGHLLPIQERLVAERAKKATAQPASTSTEWYRELSTLYPLKPWWRLR